MHSLVLVKVLPQFTQGLDLLAKRGSWRPATDLLQYNASETVADEKDWASFRLGCSAKDGLRMACEPRLTEA